MATKEISDVVTTNGLLVPKSVPYMSQQSKMSYIARVALFTAFSSILPYQASSQTGRQEEKKPSLQTEEQGKNPDSLYLEDRIIKTKQRTQLSTPKKSSEEKSTDTSTKKQDKKIEQDFDITKVLNDPKGESTKSPERVKQEKELNSSIKRLNQELADVGFSPIRLPYPEVEEPSSLRRWYDLTQAAGLETRGNYGALGLRGRSFKRGQEGGVSEDPSQRKEMVLEGIVGRDLKPFDLKKRNIVLRIVGRLYPDSISAKAAGSTETDGDGSTGSLRVTPAYKLGERIVLEPIAQYRKEDISTTRYQETDKLKTGARISFEISPETLLYLSGSSGNGRWNNGRYGPNSASGSTSSKDMEAGLRLELSEDASLEAGIGKTDTNYTGLKGENSDNISEAHLGLVNEFNDKFLLYMRGIYNRNKLQADDPRIDSSRKVDLVKAEVGGLYKFPNGLILELNGSIGHKFEEASVGFAYPIGNLDKK